jgi:hypothetical protein
MPQSSKLEAIRQRTKDCHRALVELEERTGIAEAAEKLRTEPASYLGVYDAAEPWSDEQRELTASVETSHQAYVTRRLRELYFSVTQDCAEIVRGNCEEFSETVQAEVSLLCRDLAISTASTIPT